MWYAYTPVQDTTITITTHVDGYPDVDTRFNVYKGLCNALVCVSGDDDSGPNYSSIVTFPVQGGITYLITFDNYWSSNGFTFQLVETIGQQPPQGEVLFTSQSIPGSGYIMGVVDMNGDGLDDAVTPGYTQIQVSYQQTGGGFSPVSYTTTPADYTASWSMAAGDFDGNGFTDLMYGGGSGVTFMKANDTGTGFTEVSFPQYVFSQRTNFVDINNDGHLDAFVCHDVAANVYFLNDGSGNLSFNQGGFGNTCGNYGSIWTDINNDGHVDCFIAKCGCDPQDVLLEYNTGVSYTNLAGTLGLADSHQSWSSAWGDFDNDGDMDVLIGSSSSSIHKLLLNTGGTFTNVTPGSGFDGLNNQSIEWTTHDFNNDGWLDVLGGNTLMYNNGDMTFSPGSSVPYNGCVGDLNNDGFLDVAYGSAAFMNQGNGNNWIKIIPVGLLSNKQGIGARVSVTSALGTQIRDIKSGDGFEFMSSLTAHFGLGADTEVEQVTVHWPNGTMDVIDAPAINGTLTVVEGLTTGLSEVGPEAIGIYPNPVKDVVTISGVGNGALQVAVFDGIGKQVRSGIAVNGRYDLQGLSAGTYVLRITTVDGPVLRRFVKG